MLNKPYPYFEKKKETTVHNKTKKRLKICELKVYVETSF